MTANTPFLLPASSADAVIKYTQQCLTLVNLQWNFKEQLRQIDLSYIREKDFTLQNQRAKLANKYGDSTKFQNITVPVVLPQVESAVEYQTSVFLTGQPIFGCVASPQFEDEAMMMETVIDENAVQGGWNRELMMAFRDGFKYNLGAVEVSWDQKVTAVLETDISYSATEAKPKEVIWEGNCLKRVDLYNAIFDTRVAPAEIHTKGEFAGYTEIMGRTQLKQYISTLPSSTNVKQAFESGVGNVQVAGGAQGAESYYIPQINPDAFLDTTNMYSTDWLAWAGDTAGKNQSSIEYKNIYTVTILYARIIPQDFGLAVPNRNTPQIWKFIIINFKIVIYSERQTNAHNLLPIIFLQPLEDGLRNQTKSLAQNVTPIQDITTAMWNSVIAARRRAISDRGLYDPSRVTKENINSENPSAKIPVRPSAYGKPVQDAYYPIPFRDDQSPVLMQESAQLMQFANMISGQNQVRQGQFVKGNKTQHEYADVMAHSNGRDQMVSILLEAQFFTPLKQIIKSNILQYQGATSIYNRTTQAVVSIDPVVLRKAILEFKVSDGLTPSDKLINADAFQVAIQMIGSSPQIGQGYNIAPLFSYLMKTQGADLAQFEKSQEQLAYEQAMGQWQQSVQAIVEQLIKQGVVPKQENFPPQPIPANYGFDPTGKKQQQATVQKLANPPSIIESVMTKMIPQGTSQPQSNGAIPQ